MKYLLLLILSAGACLAQKAEPVPVMQNKVEIKPAPLKCEKYEHVEYESCPRDQMVMKNWETGEFTCLRPEKSYCAPDLHTVTEREWQELMARLKKLEDSPKRAIINVAPPNPNAKGGYTFTGWEKPHLGVATTVDGSKKAKP